MFQTLSPYARENTVYRRLAQNVERACASPGMARVMINALWDYDVTGVAGAVDVPTLVIHRTSEVLPIECARWTADAIPGAKMLELPGAEHMCWFNGDDILRPQQFGLSVHVRVDAFIENDLRYAFAVSEVDEDHLAEVAPPVYPTHQHDAVACAGGPQFATGMSALKISEKV